jgi:hypothetical protein
MQQNNALMDLRRQGMEMDQQRFNLEQDQLAAQVEQQQTKLAELAQFRQAAGQLENTPEGHAQLQRRFPMLYKEAGLSSMLPEQPKPTSLMQNAEAAGFQPGTPEYQSFLRDAVNKPATQINLPGEKRETKFQEKMGTVMAEEYSGIQTAGRESHTNIARLQRAKALVQRVNTGAMKPTGVAIKRVIKDLGYDLESLGFKDDVGLAEALKAVSVDLTMDTVQRTKGAVSNKEMELFAQVAPQLSTSPEGNLLIIEMATKLHQNSQKVAQLARDYYRRKGRYDEGFYDELDEFYKKNPLFTTSLMDKVTELSGRGLLNKGDSKNPYSGVSDEDLLRSLGM